MTKLLVKNPTRTLQGVELAPLGVGEVNPEILGLWNENCIETAECELSDEDKAAIQNQLKEYFQSEFGMVCVAIDGTSKLVGYGLASLKKDLVSQAYYGQIDELYVLPEYRRQKTAQAIVEKLNRWFQYKDASFVYVFVDLDNKLAQNFWESSGLSKEFYLMSNN
ncbi:GNAT family N-acetyltransferase [Aneurinibacillus aneurinilyticus]|uniref:GNAT family N-acetyltransferase n=1 Tax=Aneurinibacillus aneurinilyticus TaxID=1391 RepID=UPI0023F8091C|nr:GNAT family N-acetyltransferase [Aneurinibacillus aneurinilyticus]MCI1696177.1 GNAT family N-acetyltransferase [Aneurinibacillus aneurinilyticus]